MRVGADLERCPRCGETLPRTEEHFHFSKSGSRAGRVTGYCKPCQSAWWKEYWSGASDYQRVRQRRAARYWNRRQDGVTPDRYAPKYKHEAPA